MFALMIILIWAQAGNVVTGEMVEELILAGADIIKVGIGPGETEGHFSMSTCVYIKVTMRNFPKGERKSSPAPCVFLYRLCVHHPQEDGGGVPAAQRRDRVCRRGPRPGGPHHLRESLSPLVTR